MNKHDLIQKVKALDGISQDERAYLIDLINTKKKYGLVWEDKPEDVEETLRQHLPVLQEVVEKRIISEPRLTAVKDEQDAENTKPQQTLLFDEIGEETNYTNQKKTDNHSSDNKAVNHTLIEGDNLHALTALTFTHENKIDVIYIDPPYNTGNKDFKYNDSFVDKEDSYRHSKWLSFMDKRLRIAKRLLSDKGVIFISIDDNEQAQVKMLCDEVFGEKCHVATLPVIMNLKGNQDNYGFSDTHEYCLVYSKTFQGADFGYFDIDEEAVFNEWLEDEYGLYKKADGLRATGVNAPRHKRKNLFYPIFINPETKEFYTTEDDIPKETNHVTLLPINDDNEELSWYWKKSNVNDFNYNLILTTARNGGFSIYKKQRPAIGEIPTKKPKTIFYKSEYSTSTSTNELKKILGSKAFNAPKPVPFISDLLKITSAKRSIILDFFAGSGTTLHATMAINAEDGGSRQCILVTNNENNICEEVTYERNKRVIEGYTNAKGVWVEGLSGNNLRYYRTATVEREPSLRNKRQLTRLATELLCIKEDCYTPRATTDTALQAFEEKTKRLLLVYDDAMIDEALEYLKSWLSETTIESPIKVYVFSNGQYPYTEDFEEVLPHITLCALPDAIYKAYQYVLPKRVAPVRVELEEDSIDED